MIDIDTDIDIHCLHANGQLVYSYEQHITAPNQPRKLLTP